MIGMSGKVADDLSEVIKKNLHLEELNLGNNNLQSSAVIIFKALKGISKLKKLYLQKTDMSCKAAYELANVIRNNPCLEELYLDSNNLQVSAKVVLKALKGISSLKKLNLDNNYASGMLVDDFYASEMLVDDLTEVIRCNNCLQSLFLFNNNLQSSAIAVLKALQSVSNLEYLNLGDNNMSQDIMDDLALVISQNTKLIGLQFDGNDLQTGFNASSNVHLKPSSLLQYLIVGDNNFTVASVTGLVTIITGNLGLKELWIGGNNLQCGIIDVAKLCMNLPKLEGLELSRSNCSVAVMADLASIVTSVSSLRALMFGGVTLSNTEFFSIQYFNELQIYSNELLHSDSVLLEITSIVMQKYLFSSYYIKYSYNCEYCAFCTQIKVLKFMDAIKQHVNAKSLSFVETAQQKVLLINSTLVSATLVDVIQKLKVLDLEYSNIGENSASELAKGLCNNNVLEQLWLRGNILCDEGVTIILKSLHNLTTLIVLDLSFNKISSKSCDDIAAVIHRNPTLEQLWLDGNCIQTGGILKIAVALKTHRRLRLLSLSSSELTEDSADALSAIITNNVLLEDLLLGSNQLLSSGFCKFSRVLLKLEKLRKLELCNNQITTECATELTVVIKHSIHLQELYLGNNLLGTSAVIEIVKALRNVSVLRVLTLNNNNVTKEASDVICDVINQHFALNILLLGGNDLQTDGITQIAETVMHHEAMQLLSVCDNGVDEPAKEIIRTLVSINPNLHFYI